MDVSPPQPDPQLPARRPYGSVRLSLVPPAALPPAPRPAAAPQPWPADRVRVPVLSFHELRHARRTG